jgi:hypothetical protein
LFIESFASNGLFLHTVQTNSGAQLTSYTTGTGASFLEAKVAGAWSWPLTSIYSQKSRMVELHLRAFMDWSLINYTQTTFPYLCLNSTIFVVGKPIKKTSTWKIQNEMER